MSFTSMKFLQSIYNWQTKVHINVLNWGELTRWHSEIRFRFEMQPWTCFLSCNSAVLFLSTVTSLWCVAHRPINMEIMGLSPSNIPCRHTHKAYIGYIKNLKLEASFMVLIPIQQTTWRMYSFRTRRLMTFPCKPCWLDLVIIGIENLKLWFIVQEVRWDKIYKRHFHTFHGYSVVIFIFTRDHVQVLLKLFSCCCATLQHLRQSPLLMQQ